MIDLSVDGSEAFKYLGLEYDMAGFYKKAEAEVNASELARAERFAKKVLSRPIAVKEPECDDTEGWEELKRQLAVGKSKERARWDKMKAAFKDVA